MSALGFVGRQAHIAGAIVATLTTIAGGLVFYDQFMPVVGKTAEHVVTPIVKAGAELTVGYIGKAPRQCPTDNIKISIIDAQGVVYSIATEKIKISLLKDEEAALTVMVPKQAALGTALLNVSYDKICNVLALWQSVHHVKFPAAGFIVEAT